MKKNFAILLILFIASFVFAQEQGQEDDDVAPLDTSVQVIVPEDQHTQNKTAQIRMEYIKGLDEMRIYYSCLEVSFKEDEARETIRQCLTDFQLANNYYAYKYMRDDRLSYRKNSRGLRQAIYMSQVKFTR